MRIITSELSTKFKFDNFGEDNNNGHYDFQYLTPTAHNHFLKTIVESYRNEFALGSHIFEM